MNILEKALKELDFEYETDGKYYKIPTNNENLKKYCNIQFLCNLIYNKE